MHPDQNNKCLQSLQSNPPVLPDATKIEDEIEDDFFKQNFQLDDLTEDGEFSENFLNEVGEEEPFGSSAMDQQGMAPITSEPAPLRSLADLHKLMRGRRGVSGKAKSGAGGQKPKAVKKPKSKTSKSGNQGKPAKPILQSWNDAKGFFFNKYPGEFLKELGKEFGKQFKFTKFLFDPQGIEEVPQLVEKIDKEAPPVLIAEVGEGAMVNQEQHDGEQEDPQATIEGLRAELESVKFQLLQAQQVIQEKERQVTDQESGIGQLNVEKARMEKRNQDLRAALDGQKKEIDALKLKMAELERIQSPPDTSSPGSTAQSSPLIVRVEATTQTEDVGMSLATSTSTQTAPEEGVEATERGQVQIKEEPVEPEEMADAAAQGQFRPVAVKEEPIQEEVAAEEGQNGIEVLKHYAPENNVFASFEEAAVYYNEYFKEAQLLARIEGEFGETFTVDQLPSKFFLDPEGERVVPQPRKVVHLSSNAFYGHFRKVPKHTKWSDLKGGQEKWIEMKKSLQFVQREMERHGLIKIIYDNGRMPRLD